ncbi:MAG: NADH-quinone oxidoreductase subunit I [Chloroflexota bacterium]|nr:NADH-quinone oxidoreductase subunit I [Chloroflexota bacterium]
MIGILKGLATTFSTFTRRPVTIQYPDEKHELSERQRSFPVLTWDFDHDEPFCTGCNICVRNCPVDCMTAVMHDNPKHPEGTSDRRKIIEKFWIDYARCMRCNICIEVCPFEAIAMDNTWEGHEHSAYDRRDLHKDIEDLLEASKSGRLPNPFRPLDSIETNAALAEGEEPPAIGFAGARPEAQDAQAERIAQGLGAAIQEREPEVQAQAATAAAGATAEDDEVASLSPRKLRARRMKAEREARAEREAGEVSEETIASLRRYASEMYTEITGEPVPPIGTPAPAAATAAPAAAAAPAGDVGDPNSPRKVRARRMKAERGAREHIEKGEEVPAELLQTLNDTESALYKEITGNDPAPAGAAPAAAPAAAPTAAGAQGDPNSPRKLRARRMKAERTAREHVEKGEPIPEDIVATITELGGTLPTAEDSGGGGSA